MHPSWPLTGIHPPLDRHVPYGHTTKNTHPHLQDFEMEQKIELEIRLRELASQSLLEARNEIDVLEVEKSLLTSDQRMNCYAGQLEAQRKQLSNPSLSTDSGRASKTSNRRGEPSLARSSGSAGATSDQHRDHQEHQQQHLGANLAKLTPQVACSTVESSRTASTGTGSPSFSSQSSPSKMSPVSGESANLATSTPLANAALSGSSAASSCHQSRPSEQPQHKRRLPARQATSSSTSGTNTLASRARDQRLNNTLARARERLKRSITSQSNINCNIVVDNKASLTLSELRVPLMWRDVDHFKGRGDYRRYAVFCLLKINSQIYDTQLISDVDRQMTDLVFDDVIVFNNVEHEFELQLEVYSCVYLEQFSLSSTPRKLKEKLSNSVSRAMGRRLATQTASVNYTKELEAYDKSYRFAMIASAKLSLPDVADSIKTYDLHLVSPEAHGRRSTQHQPTDVPAANSVSASSNYRNIISSINHSGIVSTSNQKDIHKNTLPLFGHFCARLHLRPDVFDKHVKSGYLKVASIDLTELLIKQQALATPLDRSKSRSDSPIHDSGKSSSSNDDLNLSATDNSMLRSALGASSKLASISLSNASVHWALLRNFTLHLWHIEDHKIQLAARRGHAPQVDISGKQPYCLRIDKFTRLLRVSNSSLTVETDKGCFVIAVYNPSDRESDGTQEEIGHWLRPIEQMIYDSHIWGPVLGHHPSTQRDKYR